MFKISYIDDDSMDRIFAENFTGFNENVEVTVYPNLEEALVNNPDFVLMDLFMGINAPSALKRAKILKDKKIPYAFISGVEKDYFESMREELADESKFYKKPLNRSIVTEIIGNCE